MPPTMTFGNLPIEYDDRVLEPRPWTALQGEWGADLLESAPPGPVLELCAGAGHIGLLAVSRQRRRLVCVDDSAAAAELAGRNAQAAGLGGLVELRERDLKGAVEPGERFALVLADPPWVPSDQVGRYPADPPAAIDGGPDGLGPARVCVDVAMRHLLPGASVLLQLGSTEQAETLAREVAGLTMVQVREGEGGVVVLLRPTAPD